jgi:pre-mRNA-splicing factor 18
MDLLKSAMSESIQKIENKKRIRNSYLAGGSDSEEEGATKKFLTRGEIQRLQELKKAEDQRAVRLSKAVKNDEAEKEIKEAAPVEKKRKTEGSDDGLDEEFAKDVKLKEQFSVAEVLLQLRKHGQPITLFGETPADRLQRLKQYEVQLHSQQHGSMGDKNVFQEILNNEVENDILKAMMDADTNQEQDEEERMKLVHDQEKQRKKDEKYLKNRPLESFKHTEDFVTFFFKKILREWEAELDLRPTEVKQSMHGKLATATQKQTRANLKPLFKLLSQRVVPDDILKQCKKIVIHCQKRDYRRAGEAYMLLAIGNAAWPMGVTNVGIHERAGREKIFSQKAAHVLNDEVQRKYVQAIKRIMTFCEHLYPYGVTPAVPTSS